MAGVLGPQKDGSGNGVLGPQINGGATTFNKALTTTQAQVASIAASRLRLNVQITTQATVPDFFLLATRLGPCEATQATVASLARAFIPASGTMFNKGPVTTQATVVSLTKFKPLFSVVTTQATVPACLKTRMRNFALTQGTVCSLGTLITPAAGPAKSQESGAGGGGGSRGARSTSAPHGARTYAQVTKAKTIFGVKTRHAQKVPEWDLELEKAKAQKAKDDEDAAAIEQHNTDVIRFILKHA